MVNDIQNINTQSFSTANKRKTPQENPFIISETNLIGSIQADAFTVAKNEQKKKKIAKFAIITSVVLAGAGAILGGKFIPKSFYKKVGDFFKNQVETGGKKANDFAQKASKMFKKTEYVANVSININNSKDAYLKKYLFNFDPTKTPKFLDNHPKLGESYKKIMKFIAKPFKKMDDISSGLYRKAAKSTINHKYKKLEKTIKKTDDLIDVAIKNIPDSDLGKKIKIDGDEKTVKEWFDYLVKLGQDQKTKLQDEFGKAAREELYSRMDSATVNVAQGYRETVKRAFKDKKSRAELLKFIAEDVVKTEKEAMTQEINSKVAIFTNGKTGYSDKIEEIIDVLFAREALDNKTHTKLCSKLAKVKSGISKNAEIIAEDAFDKFRDINMGCAPADVLLTAGEIGLLGLHAAQAKNKEERTSVVLTTAIPLGLGIAGTTGATLGMLSGIKALLLGGAITIASGIVGKSIDKIYRKKHNINNEKPSITTLELPKEIQDSAIAQTVDKVVETVANA